MIAGTDEVRKKEVRAALMGTESLADRVWSA
jgi:hypothetical protein